MRDTIAGLVLAIIFLGLLFAAPRFAPGGIEGVTRAEVAQIGSGFSGTRYIGSWTLACSPADAAKAAHSPASNASVGRCRMNRNYKDKFGQVVLAIAFRYAGPGKQLTMIVWYPPVGGKGEYLTLVLASKMSLRLPVFACSNSKCVAVGGLIPAAKSMLAASPQAQVVLPRGTDGKQITIGIRLDGLEPALAGMQRAEL
ncbi:MAG TPA: invasion associated locus B family protein [Rhizomicrobium sp.]|jgi:invasion protein IalB|nr:invasion associated locus B family protein [Rhizomicrobium sp.]